MTAPLPATDVFEREELLASVHIRSPAVTHGARPTPDLQVPPTRTAKSERSVPLPEGFWDNPEIAEGLAARDVRAIFRYLQRRGVSQRSIARQTGQSQSEISEILAGRSVTSYDVLLRIALGLGIPRGRLGLAYDLQGRECQALPPQLPPAATARPVSSVDDSVDDQPPVPSPSAPSQPAEAAKSSPDPDAATGRIVSLGPIMPIKDAEQGSVVRAILSATLTRQRGPIVNVGLWTGLHVRAVRHAIRMSVREFATYLGVSDRMVSKWEAGGPAIQPRPVNQEALDTALRRASPEARQRFTAILEATYIAIVADVDAPPKPPT